MYSTTNNTTSQVTCQITDPIQEAIIRMESELEEHKSFLAMIQNMANS